MPETDPFLSLFSCEQPVGPSYFPTYIIQHGLNLQRLVKPQRYNRSCLRKVKSHGVPKIPSPSAFCLLLFSPPFNVSHSASRCFLGKKKEKAAGCKAMQGEGAAAGKATWQRELLGLEQPCCWATLSIHPSPSIYQNTNSLQLSLNPYSITAGSAIRLFGAPRCWWHLSPIDPRLHWRV